MTESEWLACTDPTPMLEFLKGKASDRKLRLFAVAVYRRFWSLVTDSRNRSVVEAMEGCADGLMTEGSLAEAEKVAEGAASGLVPQVNSVSFFPKDAAKSVGVSLGAGPLNAKREQAAWWAACVATLAPVAVRSSRGARRKEKHHQAAILHDIFGNPFHPVSINSFWLTPTVTNLALAAYEERTLPSGELDPTRLAVLADALEEAGCQDGNILAHLRGPGAHVRGCWVVDLLLSKR